MSSRCSFNATKHWNFFLLFFHDLLQVIDFTPIVHSWGKTTVHFRCSCHNNDTTLSTKSNLVYFTHSWSSDDLKISPYMRNYDNLRAKNWLDSRATYAYFDELLLTLVPFTYSQEVYQAFRTTTNSAEIGFLVDERRQSRQFFSCN